MKDEMVLSGEYLMENDEESKRLDTKTNPDAIKNQARWCGIQPGTRLLDVGCGIGKTTDVLFEMMQPGGSVVGIDFSEERINYARAIYGDRVGIEFKTRDFRFPMEDLGQFDFIWVRFILEHFCSGAIDIIKNLTSNLKQDGWLCLIDLDHNCLNHWEMPESVENILFDVMKKMQKHNNFDPFVGRKLYAYLFDLGYRDIELNVQAHHLIYGDLNDSDEFNWLKKLEAGARKARESFNDYPGGFEGFLSAFKAFFKNPRRFTYTPLIICKGRKPIS